MRDVGALHMDARHADASSSFPCFLISLRAASHFPSALECRDGGGRNQHWDLTPRARTIVMQTGPPVPRLRLSNLLPPPSVHAQTRSLTLNRPTADSFICPPGHIFSPSSTDADLRGGPWVSAGSPAVPHIFDS